MNNEKITVRITASGQTLDVVVFSKRVEGIEVVLGEGVHNVRCQLTPTRNGMAYAGSAMGREIVYERSRGKVRRICPRAAPSVRKAQEFLGCDRPSRRGRSRWQRTDSIGQAVAFNGDLLSRDRGASSASNSA